MSSKTDSYPKLPLEHPLREALIIYIKRLAVFSAVVVIGFVLLGFIVLAFYYIPCFISVSLIIALLFFWIWYTEMSPRNNFGIWDGLLRQKARSYKWTTPEDGIKKQVKHGTYYRVIVKTETGKVVIDWTASPFSVITVKTEAGITVIEKKGLFKTWAYIPSMKESVEIRS